MKCLKDRQASGLGGKKLLVNEVFLLFGKMVPKVTLNAWLLLVKPTETTL
jgi:hypothetical protein